MSTLPTTLVINLEFSPGRQWYPDELLDAAAATGMTVLGQCFTSNRTDVGSVMALLCSPGTSDNQIARLRRMMANVPIKVVRGEEQNYADS